MYVLPNLVIPENIFSKPILHKVSCEDLQKSILIILKLVAYLDLIIILIFLYVIWHSITSSPVGVWFIPVFLGAIIIDFILFIIKYIKLNKEISNRGRLNKNF